MSWKECNGKMDRQRFCDLRSLDPVKYILCPRCSVGFSSGWLPAVNWTVFSWLCGSQSCTVRWSYMMWMYCGVLVTQHEADCSHRVWASNVASDPELSRPTHAPKLVTPGLPNNLHNCHLWAPLTFAKAYLELSKVYRGNWGLLSLSPPRCRWTVTAPRPCLRESPAVAPGLLRLCFSHPAAASRDVDFFFLQIKSSVIQFFLNILPVWKLHIHMCSALCAVAYFSYFKVACFTKHPQCSCHSDHPHFSCFRDKTSIRWNIYLLSTFLTYKPMFLICLTNTSFAFYFQNFCCFWSVQ